jgi:hypothetical protein
LQSLGVFHAGMQPPGAVPFPKDAAFFFDPPVAGLDYHPPERVQGVLLSQFGPAGQAGVAGMEVLVVNLDYAAERTVRLVGPAPLEVFDSSNGKWSAAEGARVELRLPPGGGKLVRCPKLR